MRDGLGSRILGAKELPSDNTIDSGSERSVNRGPGFSLRPQRVIPGLLRNIQGYQ
jgi:hypothetical protein